MADYKDIVGSKVTAVSSNPINPADGQVWYNTTDNVLRYRKTVSVAAWSSGGSLNSGRGAHGQFGTQTVSLAFGGLKSDAYKTLTESYNGSSWTEVNDLNTGRAVGAPAGVPGTAGLYINGEKPGDPSTSGEVESWNGTSWTEITDTNTASKFRLGAGIQTSALAIGGGASSPADIGNTEAWNGSAWTEVNDLNTARGTGAAAGADNTSALLFGGGPPSFGAAHEATEQWNGTSWTNVADLNTAMRIGSGGGIATEAICMGRFTPSSSTYGNTESWDGTSWTEVNNMSTGVFFAGGSGTTSAALCVGGRTSPTNKDLATSEEFDAINTIAVD